MTDFPGPPVYGPPLPPPRRRRVPLAATAALILAVGMVSVGIGHALWPSHALTTTASASTRTASSIDDSVVDINVTFRYQQAAGAGTGIVLTSTGEVLTNNHVINGATSIQVTDIGNGRTYNATVVGYDSSADVAVLQLQGASGLQTAAIGSSSNLQVGQAVTAVGNAGGMGGTPSHAAGSITALDQAITASDELDGTAEQLSGLIQVNADVQSGDSGGPLVNESGRVIGMDTAASSGYSLQSSSTQGFAIPINDALSIAHQIEAGNESSQVHIGPTAFLGVLLSSNGFNSGGATVAGVTPGGAAADAGLSSGDVITSLNGQSVSSNSGLSALMASERPGDRVHLGWIDSAGQSHTATVDLGSGPAA